MSEQTEQTDEAPAAEEAPQCAFPGCTVPPVPKDPTAPGRAPKYCSDPEHNAMSSFRAKRGKSGGAKPTAEEPSDRVVTDAARTAGIVQGTVLQKVDELRTELARYVDLLQTVTDPEAAEAEVAAVAATADSQVAEWRKKTTTANTERDAAMRQRDLARAETEEAQEAAERAITLLEEGTARFEQDLEKARTEAEERIQRLQAEADQAIKKATDDAEQRVVDLQAEADRKVADAKDTAAKEVKAVEDAAGKAKVESDRQVREMEQAVKDEKAAAETATAEAEKAVKAAQAKVTVAEEAVRTATARAEQAERDAETRVTAEKERRTEQEKAHAAELGRAVERQRELAGQVDTLHTTVNATKDEKREVQTQLTLAQAEVKRLTAAAGGK